MSCHCEACTLGCEPPECRRLARFPQPWRAELDTLVAEWVAQHRGRHELDAADVALDLGLVDLGFVGADLHAIAVELVMVERERDVMAAVVTYGQDGERKGARCPRCLEQVERHNCSGVLRSEPIQLETALRLSTATAHNDTEAA